MTSRVRAHPPLRNEMRSALSLELERPAKAIELPGAKSAGDFNHLSKLPSVHFNVAFDAKAEE